MSRTKSTAKKTTGGAKKAAVTNEAPAKLGPVVDPAPVAEIPVADEAPKVISKKAPKTVTVMCREPVGVTFRVRDKFGTLHMVKINGYGEALRGLDKGILVPGWGMTHGVDAELWAEIEKMYARTLPLFTRGMIQAFADAQSAKDEAENLKDVKSSLDPVDIDKTHTAEV